MLARLGVVELNVVCCSCWCEGLLRLYSLGVLRVVKITLVGLCL